MIERNLTVRLFDDIGVHETVMRLRRGEEAGDERTDKRELRQEYSMPAIIARSQAATPKQRAAKALAKGFADATLLGETAR